MEPTRTSVNTSQDFLQQAAEEKRNTLSPEYPEANDDFAKSLTAIKNIHREGLNEMKVLTQKMFSEEVTKVLQQTSKPAEAAQVKTKVAQFQRKLDTMTRLKSTHFVKQLEKMSDALEKELMPAIEKIGRTVRLAEERHCHPLNITAQDLAQKADKVFAELIQEEEREKKSQALKLKPKKGKAQSPTPPIKKKETAPVIASQREQGTPSNLESRLSQFALKIMEESFRCCEHRRIQRWQANNFEEIRAFVDFDAKGQKILRYKNLSDERIQEQRARHFLPGTERLLKDPSYREIYTFPTDTGFGVVAQLIFNQMVYNGILYFGIDKSQIIFHKYFEDVDFNSSTKNVFQDVQKNDVEEKEIFGEWSSESKFNLDISKQGVFQFDYSEHHIRIFPIRKELFDKKISTLS